MKPKRGRPPLGRKAMTAAQRQARRRAKVRQKIAEETRRYNEMRGIGVIWQPYLPPPGYNEAKKKLMNQGLEFERARREFGFEEGIFVDGAFVNSYAVVELAALPPTECRQQLAERRRETKDNACAAVDGYMRRLRVSLEELSGAFARAVAEAAE